jgi:hypothetical protein
LSDWNQFRLFQHAQLNKPLVQPENFTGAAHSAVSESSVSRIRGAEYLEPNVTLRRFVKRNPGKKHDVDDTRLENQRVAMEDVR